MSYLKKIGALFVSSALMASMLAGCGSSSASTGDSGSQAEGGDGDGPAGMGLVGKHIGRGGVRGFTITGGAIASTIGHDSHNVCVVGDNAADMMAAVEAVGQGGHVLVRNGEVVARIPLALGGLMSEGTAEDVAAQHDDFMVKARAMGIEPPLDPIMGIIILPLTVIPTLSIRNEGKKDVTTKN